MNLQTILMLFFSGWLFLGIAAIYWAIHFGSKYQQEKKKHHKYLCVSCTVVSCVSLITCLQMLIFMFVV